MGRAGARSLGGIGPSRAGDFALVMATGIVSLAADEAGLHAVARLLFGFNVVAYAVLALLLLGRVAVRRDRVAAELEGPDTGHGFLAIVAATSVVGAQCESLAAWTTAAAVLLALAAALWLPLFPAWAASLAARRRQGDLAGRVSGGWLLATVAPQSLAVLLCLIASRWEWSALFPVGLALWLLGAALYVPVIALVIRRLAFLPLEPAECRPPYWIAMGALAITALAGARLTELAASGQAPEALIPPLRAATSAVWGLATAWIPVLLALGVWRHVVRRQPLRYEVGYWAMVFPLGMYAASTRALARTGREPALGVIARLFAWLALAVWALVLVGLVRNVIRRLTRAGQSARPPGTAESNGRAGASVTRSVTEGRPPGDPAGSVEMPSTIGHAGWRAGSPTAARESIDPRTTVGPVHLTVRDLDRAVEFYEQQLGLRVRERREGGAWLGAGGPDLLVLGGSPGAPRARRTTGLYHFALLVPTRRDLARALKHFLAAQTGLQGAADHLVSEALYLADPEGNGIEVYRDRPRAEWSLANGELRMTTDPLDVNGLIAEAVGAEPWNGLPAGTRMGHVHLRVANLEEAERFYVGGLGFERMTSFGHSALFVSAGGYHHHLGLNTWLSAGAPPPPAGSAGLDRFEILLPDEAALEAVLARARHAGVATQRCDDGYLTSDPSGNRLVLRVGSDEAARGSNAR